MRFGNVSRKTLGQVKNPASVARSIDVPQAIIVLGAGAIGAFVGTQIGGPLGAAVGAIVGGNLGKLALGQVRSLKVSLNRFGTVEVVYQCA